MPCLINSQTLKMISQVESFLCLHKQKTPEEGLRIHRPKQYVSIHHNKDEDNSPKNHNQNNTNKIKFYKKKKILFIWASIYNIAKDVN